MDATSSPTLPGFDSVGVRLRRLRLTCGLSLAHAAAAGHVSKSALAHWESGRRLPPGHTLKALLDIYGVEGRETSSLLARADPRYARLALVNVPRGPAASVGEVLRAMRLRRGLTQADLAGRLKLAQSTVARWERGDIEIDATTIQSALFTLGASADEVVAIASLDPMQRPSGDLEERYERIAKGPHELAETLWIGLEADLWWRATESNGHDRMLQTVIGHRADWCALSLRPQETGPLALRAIRIGFGPPSDVPQGVAYGIVQSTIQMQTDPLPALRVLKGWMTRLRTASSLSRVHALRGLLVAEIDETVALDIVRRAQQIAGDDGEAYVFATQMLARVHLKHQDFESTMRTLEGDDHVDGLTIRALALARLGQKPPDAWMEAIRQRPATHHVPLYRERLHEIERTMARTNHL